MQTDTPANQKRKRKQKHTFTMFNKNIPTQQSTIQKNHQTKEKTMNFKNHSSQTITISHKIKQRTRNKTNKIIDL